MSEIYENIKHGLSTIINDIHGDKHYAGVIDSLSDMYTSYTGAIKIMFMGGFSVGKSSLINTILKRNIADISAVPTTSAITVFRYGADEKFIVHYSDGKQETGKLEDLSVYTSELARKTAVDKIQMVECFLNENILMKYTFVDSPGLNANKEHHNDITLNFVNMVDAVLWVFDAHWAAGNDDVQHMRALPERLKPLVVINQIDVLDEDEGDDVEEFLAEIKLKCGDAAIDVVGVSAEMAKYGQEYNNAACLRESNLDGLMEAVKKYTCGKYEVLKIQHLIESFGAEIDNILQCKDKSDRYRVWGFEKVDHRLFLERFTASKNCAEDLRQLAALLCASSKQYTLSQECVDTANNLSGKIADNIKDFLSKREYLCLALGGTVAAQYALAKAYIEKYGETSEAALKWLYMAGVEGENLSALQILYKRYEEGKFSNMPSNTVESIYEKAALQGDIHAEVVLIKGLYLGKYRITKNVRKALEWMERKIRNVSCSHRNLYMYWIADECLSGENISKDELRAFRLYQKLYDEGFKPAEIPLGDMYYEGKGTSVNLMWAYKLYAVNGEEGWKRIKGHFINDNYDFQIKIAHEYRDGNWILGRDYAKARDWYELAYSHGNAEGAFYLGEVLTILKDYDTAISWYTKYAEVDSEASCKKIAAIYIQQKAWERLEQLYKQYNKDEELGNLYVSQRTSFGHYRIKAINRYIKAGNWHKAGEQGKIVLGRIIAITCVCYLLLYLSVIKTYYGQELGKIFKSDKMVEAAIFAMKPANNDMKLLYGPISIIEGLYPIRDQEMQAIREKLKENNVQPYSEDIIASNLYRYLASEGYNMQTGVASLQKDDLDVNVYQMTLNYVEEANSDYPDGITQEMWEQMDYKGKRAAYLKAEQDYLDSMKLPKKAQEEARQEMDNSYENYEPAAWMNYIIMSYRNKKKELQNEFNKKVKDEIKGDILYRKIEKNNL